MECATPTQLYLPRIVKIDQTKPINISKIIHRSPFRYQGGKTWFIPYLRQWMLSQSRPPSFFIEPFSGGAICSLTVAFENWVEHVIFSEIDNRIASVWKTILGGNHVWLSERIQNFQLNKKNVINSLQKEDREKNIELREKAFYTILRNRVQRGGIMTQGAGLIKNGENGRGLGSRWYPNTLSNRILDIAKIKEKLTFEEMDGFELIERYKDENSAVFFIDPPYTNAAKRLYNHWQFDNHKLFNKLHQIKSDFIITFDNTNEIKKLADLYDFPYIEIAMKNTHNTKMTELLIGRDLTWLDLES